MDTNAALRQRALRWIRLGVNQKALAHRMGLSESQFSRWLRGEHSRPIPVSALDGLKRFVEEVQREAAIDPTTLTKEEQAEIDADLKNEQMKRAIRTTSRTLKGAQTGKTRKRQR